MSGCCMIPQIISRFEKRGFKLVASKFMRADAGLLEEVSPKPHMHAHVPNHTCMHMSQITHACTCPKSHMRQMQHYAEHRGKPFLPGLVSRMTSGPVFPMVWEGTDVVRQVRVPMHARVPMGSGSLARCWALPNLWRVTLGRFAVTTASTWDGTWFTAVTLPHPLNGKSISGSRPTSL
eukprot:Polyplicarium_translucidae@DN2779_c0_g2_i2.p1